MKRRYLYAALVGVPGLIDALILTFVLFGVTVGFLWLFVFGDNPWPAYVERLLPVLLVLVFVTIWFATMLVGYMIGKGLEQDPILNRKHILISATVTVLSILLILSAFLYRTGIPSLGPRSAEVRCAEFCSQKGYMASGVSPQISAERTCSCFDKGGVEVITVPIGK